MQLHLHCMCVRWSVRIRGAMNPLFTGSKSRGRFFLNALVKITGNFEQPNEPVGLVSTETCSLGQNEPAHLKIVTNPASDLGLSNG